MTVYFCSWPSIHPWQSAPSMASCLDTLGTPEPFFPSLSQIPLDERGCPASHRSHSEVDSNAITGRGANIEAVLIRGTVIGGSVYTCLRQFA